MSQTLFTFMHTYVYEEYGLIWSSLQQSVRDDHSSVGTGRLRPGNSSCLVLQLRGQFHTWQSWRPRRQAANKGKSGKQRVLIKQRIRKGKSGKWAHKVSNHWTGKKPSQSTTKALNREKRKLENNHSQKFVKTVNWEKGNVENRSLSSQCTGKKETFVKSIYWGMEKPGIRDLSKQ